MLARVARDRELLADLRERERRQMTLICGSASSHSRTSLLERLRGRGFTLDAAVDIRWIAASSFEVSLTVLNSPTPS